jgi:hypothetical protein
MAVGIGERRVGAVQPTVRRNEGHYRHSPHPYNCQGKGAPLSDMLLLLLSYHIDAHGSLSHTHKYILTLILSHALGSGST